MMHERDLLTIETNIPGVRAFREPPSDFMAEKASEMELSRYGFPPKPDPRAHPKRYTSWKKLVGGAYTRIVPELRMTNIRHGTVTRISKIGVGPGGVVVGTSPNWSGFVIIDDNNPFVSPRTQIGAQWVVPMLAHQEASPYGEFHSVHWVGIDGDTDNSNPAKDVLQAGTHSIMNWPDPNSLPAWDFHAWLEWFPNPEIRIDNLPARPGDHMDVSVMVDANGNGNIIVANMTTNQTSPPLQIAPPPGVALLGNCVEWIVERPTVNGQYSKLANYITLFMEGCICNAGTGRYYPGMAATGTIWDVKMTDNGPIHGGVVLSQAYVMGEDPMLPDDILFHSAEGRIT